MFKNVRIRLLTVQGAERLGRLIQRWWPYIIGVILFILICCCIPLRHVTIELDTVKLWVEDGGRLNDELRYSAEVKKIKNLEAASNLTDEEKHLRLEKVCDGSLPADDEDRGDGGLSGGFTLFIQTPRRIGSNILTQEDLLMHAQLLEDISQMSVEYAGFNFTLQDICFKPPQPPGPSGFLGTVTNPMIEAIIPCIIATPIDCFWDGSRALGPNPPIVVPDFIAFFNEKFEPFIGELTWKNLNPQALMATVSETFDLAGVGQLLQRAGLGDGYQNRPCLDPYDMRCPDTAPNKVKLCEIIDRWQKYNERVPSEKRLTLVKEDVPKDQEEGRVDYAEVVEPVTDKRPYECRAYVKSMTEVLKHTPHKARPFTPSDMMPKPELNYGRILKSGCDGFARKLLGWPDSLILGGIERSENMTRVSAHVDGRSLTKAEAFQSIMFLASPEDVYSRFHNRDFDPLDKDGWMEFARNETNWNVTVARDILTQWQREFTRQVYSHPNNTDGLDERQLHPLAPTSITDMMEQFSEFKWGLIFVGYLFMFLYAGLSNLSFNTKPCIVPAVNSYSALGFIGVLIVTLASVAGLGFATALGISFNAATTQIVPFLTLGLGVDDMFLLVHSYAEIVEAHHGKDEIAHLLRETGLSVILTSVSNIMAFSVGSLIPIPAMRSFCLQVAIVLAFNLLSIVTLFPAVMCIDLLRRQHNLMDLFCCFGGYVKKHHEVTIVDYSLLAGSRRFSLTSLASLRQPHSHYKPFSTHRERLMRGSVVDSIASPPPADDDEIASLSTAAPFGSTLEEGTGGVKTVSTVRSPPSTTYAVQKMSPATRPQKYRHNALAHCTLHHFVHSFYIPMLQLPIIKVVILLISAAMFCIGLYGLRGLEDGLELSDVMAKGSAAYDFLQAREKYFSFYNAFIVLKCDNDMPHKQHEMMQLRRDILDTKYTVRGARLTSTWFLSLFHDFLFDLQDKIDVLRERNLVNATHITANPCGDLNITESNCSNTTYWLAYHALCSVGDKVDCTRVTNTRLITGSRDEENGNATANIESFYNLLTAWYNVEQMMYGVSQAEFQPTPPKWQPHFNIPASVPDEPIPAASPLVYAQIPFFLTNLTHTPPIVEMIQSWRAVCERYEEQYDLKTFPTGIPFTFWEQYLHMRRYLLISLAVITLCVFVVLSALLMSVWTGSICVATLIIVVVELAGVMGLAGLKLNPVSAVSVITAVGIGVEFTVHVSFYYLISSGTPNERLGKTLSHMFVPVIHGGTSTLLGIIMLLFSEFEFIIRYFFLVLCALVLLGIFNGLALLPVVLSLIGPPTEVITDPDGLRGMIGERKQCEGAQQSTARMHPPLLPTISDHESD